MKNFSRMLLNLKDFAEICDSFGSGRTPMLASGLSGIHKAHFIYAITQIIERQGLVITPDEPSALRICEDINAFFGPDHQQMAFYYPARELTYRDVEGVSREYEHARLKVLGLLSGGLRRGGPPAHHAASGVKSPDGGHPPRGEFFHGGAGGSPSQGRL